MLRRKLTRIITTFDPDVPGWLFWAIFLVLAGIALTVDQVVAAILLIHVKARSASRRSSWPRCAATATRGAQRGGVHGLPHQSSFNFLLGWNTCQRPSELFPGQSE